MSAQPLLRILVACAKVRSEAARSNFAPCTKVRPKPTIFSHHDRFQRDDPLPLSLLELSCHKPITLTRPASVLSRGRVRLQGWCCDRLVMARKRHP